MTLDLLLHPYNGTSHNDLFNIHASNSTHASNIHISSPHKTHNDNAAPQTPRGRHVLHLQISPLQRRPLPTPAGRPLPPQRQSRHIPVFHPHSIPNPILHSHLTGRHKYAGISGTIEPTDASPLAAAWRELAEETTLTDARLKLFRAGEPYSFVDEGLRREWTIHPFGFVLVNGEEGGDGGDGEGGGICIDWEHESYAWFDPKAVTDEAGFGGVPRLAESLGRVWGGGDGEGVSK